MIQRILVPIAFSPYTQGIINYSTELAQLTGAEIILANVINARDLEAVDKIMSYGYKVDVEGYLGEIKAERRKKITEYLAPLTLPDEKMSYTFCIGDPTTELIKLILEREVDTVVMGVKTRDIRHVFTGSVAEQMFRKCPVNIISVREDDLRERLVKKFRRHHKKETI